MPESVRHVLLLDLDNTLIDRDRAFAKWLVDLLTRRGLDAACERSLQIMADIIASDDHARNDRELFCRQVALRHPDLAPSPQALWREITRLPDFVEPAPAVREMLERLSGRWSLRVVSNGSGEIQRRKMTAAGLDGLFDGIWISGEQGMEKPSAEIFLRALGSDSPHKAVMVGDDPFRDILPACALGMATVHVDPSHGGLQPLPPAKIQHILQLEEILR